MRRLVLGFVLLLGLLTGCQTVGNVYDRMFGGNRPAQKPAPLVAFTPKVHPRVLWQGNVGPAEQTVFFPAVSGNVVFAAGARGHVSGFQANTGKLLASFDTHQPLAGGVAANGSMVLAATPKGEIVAYNLQGKVLWRKALNAEILAPPAMQGSLVVARTTDGHIYGLNASNGTQRWVYERITPALSLRTYSGVVLDRGAVFAGFSGGRLLALNAENGAVGWDGVVAIPHGTTELERVADVIGLPVVVGRQVCAVAYQGRVACFDARTGTTDWAHEMSSVAGLGGDDRNLYVTDEHNAVVALDVVNGGSVWKQDKLYGRNVTAPLALGRYIVVGDFEGYVHLLSRDDGAFVGRIATDGSAIMVPPVALDLRSFVVQTQKGGVFAISIE